MLINNLKDLIAWKNRYLAKDNQKEKLIAVARAVQVATSYKEAEIAQYLARFLAKFPELKFLALEPQVNDVNSYWDEQKNRPVVNVEGTAIALLGEIFLDLDLELHLKDRPFRFTVHSYGEEVSYYILLDQIKTEAQRQEDLAAIAELLDRATKNCIEQKQLARIRQR